MLYQLLYDLSVEFSALNVFRYITFRSFIAFFTAFFVCWFWGPFFIRRMVRGRVGQTIRDDGPQSHLKKSGTPTMGGTIMLGGILLAALLWTDLTNPLAAVALIVTLAFGGVGFLDDYLKVSKKNTRGLPGKVRLLTEFTIAAVAVGALLAFGYLDSLVHVPFLKNVTVDLGWTYVVFASLVIVGCANAVNLTDGLDGLAVVPVVISAGTLMLFAYIAGHSEIARYLAIPYIAGAGEVATLAAAVVAAGLGFLWYNSYPAQVFMGDVGSLGLGGFLGVAAVLTKNELLLVVLGGVFVVEAISVIAQVASFRLTGKRVLRMAPIHHHFELNGMVENKIIVRFWIVSILLAVLSLTTLKLR